MVLPYFFFGIGNAEHYLFMSYFLESGWALFKEVFELGLSD
jgi:hypothetical protein